MAKTTQRGSCETCTYYTYDEEYERDVYKRQMNWQTSIQSHMRKKDSFILERNNRKK